jgi:hypothetical protein
MGPNFDERFAVTTVETQRLDQLRQRARDGQIDAQELSELVHLRRAHRSEVDQCRALQRFESAARIWRVSLAGYVGEGFPFYTIRKMTAEYEMEQWALGDLTILEEIKWEGVPQGLHYDPGTDCYFLSSRAIHGGGCVTVAQATYR